DATGGGEVHALIAGAPGVSAKADALGKVGADLVVVVEHPGLANFERESVAATLAARAKAGSYRAVMLGFSAQGRDLGPRLAAKLDARIVTDVIDVQASGDTLTVKHPAYANKVIMTLSVRGPLAIVSMRPSAFTPAPAERAVHVESMTPVVDPTAARVRV